MSRPLTRKEIQTLSKMGSGKSTKEIAAESGCSGKAIEARRMSISKKLGVSGVQPLTALAASNGLIEEPEQAPVQVLEPMSMKSIEDMEKLILRVAEETSGGRVNLVLCQCIATLTSSLVEIAGVRLHPRYQPKQLTAGGKISKKGQ